MTAKFPSKQTMPGFYQKCFGTVHVTHDQNTQATHITSHHAITVHQDA